MVFRMRAYPHGGWAHTPTASQHNLLEFFLCSWRDSNPRPFDLQFNALTTGLTRHPVLRFKRETPWNDPVDVRAVAGAWSLEKRNWYSSQRFDQNHDISCFVLVFDLKERPRIYEEHKKNVSVFPSQKCDMDSLYMFPNPVCIGVRTHKNDQVRTIKIL